MKRTPSEVDEGRRIGVRRPVGGRVPALAMAALPLFALACSDSAAPIPDDLIFQTAMPLAWPDHCWLGLAGSQVPDTLAVRARDTTRVPLEGVPIRWSMTTVGGSVEPEVTTTNADGVARTVWTLGPQLGEQHVRALTPADDTVDFCAIANPEPPDSWVDVMDVALTMEPADFDPKAHDTLTARVEITNRWIGTLRLTTTDSALETTSVFDADGNVVFRFPAGWWQAPAYFTIAPGDVLAWEWRSGDVDLEPGEYTARTDFHVVAVNGETMRLEDVEATFTIR